MKKFYLFLILVIATILRMHNIAAISLWHDEAFSALLIKYPWGEMFYRIGLDVHPPLYYVTLRFWSDIFGNSVLALRGFSAFFGVGTVYATYLFVKAAFKNEKMALAGALLMAVNPFQISYVTEARMYTFGTFVLMISAYFLVRALQLQKIHFGNEQRGEVSKKLLTKVWAYWILFTLATSAAMYTHYYLFFSVFAIAIFVLYYHFKTYPGEVEKHSFFALVSYLIVLTLYVPWLKTFIFQFNQVQNNYWIPKPDQWSVPIIIWKLLIGRGTNFSNPWMPAVLILATILTVWVIFWVLRNRTELEKWLVVLALVVPFIGAYALSVKQSIFLERYFLFAGLFYTVMLLVYIYEYSFYLVRWFLVFVITVLWLFNGYATTKDLTATNYPGMAAAAAYINNNFAAGNKLVSDISFEYFNFKYYNQTGVNPLLYTAGLHIVDLPHFSGTALLNEKDLLTYYEQAGKNGDIVWIIYTNAFGRGDHQPYVPKTWKLLAEKSWNDVRPYPGTEIIVDKYLIK